MINKKEFDLLLQEIFKIENKIVEVKVLNQFDKAKEYENILEAIRIKAKDIVLDNDNKSEGFDEISLEVLSKLVLLDSDIDYYILKFNNVIESATQNKMDAEALEKLKKSWIVLKEEIDLWKEESHNPIEEIEHNKYVGKTSFDIAIYQLQIEGVLDFTKIFSYCSMESLENAIKETLFDGAKNEENDEIKRNQLINLAKNLTEKDIYDYKLWKQLLVIKGVTSRDDHMEIIGNIYEKDNRKYVINEEKNNRDNELEVYDNESIFATIKSWFSKFNEASNQRKMKYNWISKKGPAFKIELEDGQQIFVKENIDINTIKKAKKLTISTNGVAKYNFEANYKWENLEELNILDGTNMSCVSLSPDRIYNCIGNDSFSDSPKLKYISFGKIQIIGQRAFKNCTSLESITFSENVINIGEDAFLGCTNLNRVEFLGDLKLYIAERPQNIINCFRETNLEEIVFLNSESAFNFAIIDCPKLKRILVSSISNISVPFKTCKYRLGRQEGIVTFVGEKALNLWRKRNKNIRFFELTDEDKKKYNINI